MKFFVAIVLCLYLTACTSTVIPDRVEAAEASFGETGAQDSGFKEFVAGGALIDAGARARYNALIAAYGEDSQFMPRLKKDHGIRSHSAGIFFITNDALKDFVLMNNWRRQGKKPR